VAPALGALTFLGDPLFELALGEELENGLVLQVDLDRRRPQDVDEAELEELGPEGVEDVHQQTSNMCANFPCVKCRWLAEANHLHRHQ